MSKYQDIQSTFISLREAESAYWEKLVSAQKALRKGLASFLGVDVDKPFVEGGPSAIYFGGKPSAFGGRSNDETVREGNELIFTLNVVLDATEQTFPPNELRFRCRTKYVAGHYMFYIQDRDTSFTMIDDEDFTPIYEHLHLAMVETLATYKRL